MEGNPGALLRNSSDHDLAEEALRLMKQYDISPTPLNFELWFEYTANPQGEIASKIKRLIESSQQVNEEVKAKITDIFLARNRPRGEIVSVTAELTDKIEVINRELEKSISSSIKYDKTLVDVSAQFLEELNPQYIKYLIHELSIATRSMQQINGSLRQQLHDSKSEIARLHDHLDSVRHDSMTDSLTMLANRKAFDEHLGRTFSDPAAASAPLTLAMIDIDHFKIFNDKWGHQTGDDVLRFVANTVGRVGETLGFAARFGGEEFAIISASAPLNVIACELEAMRVAIASRILRLRSTKENLGVVTISIGIAVRLQGENQASLIQRADSALYESKNKGRNQISIAKENAYNL